MDGRPNRRNKAALPIFFSGVVWMMPKRNTIVYDSHLNITFLLFFDACKCYGYVNIFI